MRRAAIAVFALLFTACESEVTAPEETLSEGRLTLDATSTTGFVYVKLGNGGQVVQPADPTASTEWDIAFRRYMVKLNGGIAGAGQVAAAAMGPNTNATAEQIAALTAANADAGFAGVTAADIAGASFREEGLVEDEGGTWFRFDPQAGTLVANPASVWKVRQADGGYALFRVSSLQMSGEVAQGMTVQFRRQSAGGTLGGLSTVTVQLTAGPAFVNFSSGTVVTGSGCGWDMVLRPSLEIGFNGDCGAGTFPVEGGVEFASISRADDAPQYGPFLAVVAGAIPSSISDASGIFWYNIQGNNRLWPTYNVFLVRSGDDVFKVQVTDYYSATGTSGHVALRFEQLR